MRDSIQLMVNNKKSITDLRQKALIRSLKVAAINNGIINNQLNAELSEKRWNFNLDCRDRETGVGLLNSVIKDVFLRSNFEAYKFWD